LRLRDLDFSSLRVVLLFVAVGATACLMPAQADTYWHLRAGQDLFRSGHVQLTELYSHTARGRPWPNHEWLWQAISYGSYRMGGMPLLQLLAASCVTLAVALAYRAMRARPSVNFVLALLGIPLASVSWALRPQAVSLLFLIVLLHLLLAQRFWLLPALFLVWANLHGAVAMGGVVLTVATIVSAFDDERARFRKLLVATIVSGLATALTPMGLGLWRFIGQSIARSRQNQILEWLPAYPRGPIEIGFWVGALALMACTLRRWRRLGSWQDRVTVAAALVLVPLAARAVRNISPFFLLWLPAMSRLIGPQARLPRARPSAGEPSVEHPRLNLALVAVAGVGATIAIGWCFWLPLDRLGWHPIPDRALAAIAGCPGPLYNRYNEGGYLIWFAPEVPVFIDSRQDPYPPELLTAHAAAERSGDFAELFARYHIGCAALPPNSPVALRLTAARWIEKFRDDSWVVFHPAASPRVGHDSAPGP